ncbi:MAG: hydrogenase maturation protease [Proteobacteria bacterium]|nr:hydrogenase maturation protease [Pseudomonadota bacterium]MBU2573603.1 hydrogenase maturation protease [Elusimicrobiota bacterium]
MDLDPAADRYESEDIKHKRVLVIGCGNVLIGDDGFGPTVIKHLSERSSIPADVGLVDAGTGIRTLLFNIILSESKPERIIVVDAIDVGKKPGEVFEVSLESIPAVKSDDFSMHQLPTSNMLRELRDECKVAVEVIAVQVQSLPEEVRAGLSAPVSEAVAKVHGIICRKLDIPA